MKKIVVISGPTATGKTAIASKLAKEYNGELVSGDSCQIYKGMDIGTGKDQPDETPIHLIDIIEPNQRYSVAEFRKIGLETIDDICRQGKLPILVGCSGFYIDAIINPNYDTFSVKPNSLLRFFLNVLPVGILQKIYKIIDAPKYKKLNNSDINNRYRLVRKIEIRMSKVKKDKKVKSGFDILHINLTAPLPYIYDRIDKRVKSRMDEGFLSEVERLLKKYKWSDVGMQIAAYKCLKPYFDNPKKEILDDCLTKWKYAEHSDARRQSCWFKSKSKAVFIDITKADYDKKILDLMSKWYNVL